MASRHGVKSDVPQPKQVNPAPASTDPSDAGLLSNPNPLRPFSPASQRPAAIARRQWQDDLHDVKERRWREGNDSYSSRALARKVGVSQTRFMAVLRGERPMPADWLDLLPLEMARELMDRSFQRRMAGERVGLSLLADGIDRVALAVAGHQVVDLDDLDDALERAEKSLATVRRALVRRRGGT